MTLGLKKILAMPDEALVPIGWVREHLSQPVDSEVVAYRLQITVAGAYWAGVIRGEYHAPLARRGPTSHIVPQLVSPDSQPTMPKRWSDKFGTKGVSRVRIFSRPKVSPFIWMEWHTDGKRKTKRLTFRGSPLLADSVEMRNVARDLARSCVETLEEDYKRAFFRSMARNSGGIRPEARALLGLNAGAEAIPKPDEPRVDRGVRDAASITGSGTIGDMLDKWLSREKRDLRHKRSSTKNLKAAMGKDTVVSTLVPDDFDKGIDLMAQRREWKSSTRVRHQNHLRAALKFAKIKLGWDVPDWHRIEVDKRADGSTDHLTYTILEYEALIQKALREGDLRLAALVGICGRFGRRITQTLGISLSDCQRIIMADGVSAIEFTFHLEGEKAREFKDTPYTVAALNAVEHPLAYEAVDRLLETLGVRTSGQLFPSVQLSQSLDEKLPTTRVTYDTALRHLHELEEKADVTTVKNRGFHGLKRFAATYAETEEELRLIARLSNTSYEMLWKRYHKKRGAFVARATRKAQEESLSRRLAEQAKGAA